MDPDGETKPGGGASDRAGVLRSGLLMSGLHIDDLWANCIAIDGSLSLARLEAALAGSEVLDDHQHDVVAQALNDRFVDMDLNHLVPYADEI